jgi:hypothetical protein
MNKLLLLLLCPLAALAQTATETSAQNASLPAAPSAPLVQPFEVTWFNPRAGGGLQPARPFAVAPKSLNAPSGDDWLAVIRRN